MPPSSSPVVASRHFSSFVATGCRLLACVGERCGAGSAPRRRPSAHCRRIRHAAFSNLGNFAPRARLRLVCSRGLDEGVCAFTVFENYSITSRCLEKNSRCADQRAC
eukprot:5288487-Pleurochrysis_carterae.AAC.1